MKQYFKAKKVTGKVYWVGAADWEIKNFHGYATERGTTYNAFLILDEKITLIDTVKAPFREEMMARISSVIDPERIDYIVSNHSEMDHSGALPEVVAAIKPEKVFASEMGEKNLKAHFGADFSVTPVKTGDKISLGANHLTFIESKMLHWPDSMFSYLDGEKILFSQDAFGMHLAGLALFSDEYPTATIDWESAKYFANILMPYAPKILGILEQLPGFSLDIAYLAPDHGPIRRTPLEITRVLNQYREWSLQKPAARALVVFDTMWHSTGTMARTIADGISNAGIEAEVIPLQSRDRSYLAAQMLFAGALIVGSPTLNNNLLPSVADTLTYLKGLRPQHKIGAAFASYGWSGESLKQVEQYLQETGIESAAAGVKVKYVPTEQDLRECFALGAKIAAALTEKLKKQD